MRRDLETFHYYLDTFLLKQKIVLMVRVFHLSHKLVYFRENNKDITTKQTKNPKYYELIYCSHL